MSKSVEAVRRRPVRRKNGIRIAAAKLDTRRRGRVTR